jgi:hypothetical protein
MRVAAPAQRARIDRTLSLIGLLAVPTSVAVALPNLDYSAWSQGGWFMGMVWGILAYVALFTLYMPFFYTVIASLSVRTIILLAQESDGTLPIAFLFDQFGSQALVARRLNVMTQNGLVSQFGNEYRLTPKGRFIAQFFASLKRFWRLWPGG